MRWGPCHRGGGGRRVREEGLWWRKQRSERREDAALLALQTREGAPSRGRRAAPFCQLHVVPELRDGLWCPTQPGLFLLRLPLPPRALMSTWGGQGGDSSTQNWPIQAAALHPGRGIPRRAQDVPGAHRMAAPLLSGGWGTLVNILNVTPGRLQFTGKGNRGWTAGLCPVTWQPGF